MRASIRASREVQGGVEPVAASIERAGR